jgi:flagellar biogenesis protein FliO
MYKDSLQSALKTAKNDLKRERVVQRNKPIRQFKQLFVILGFILTLFFVFILLRKRVL